MKTVIFTVSGRCVFSRGITTNQKQTQQEEEKHDNAHCSPLVTVPGCDWYPEKNYKVWTDRTSESASTSYFDILSNHSASGHRPFSYRQKKTVVLNALWKSIHYNRNQAKMSDMFLMVVHCSIAYYGLEDPHMMVYVRCMSIMWNKDMAHCSCYCFWWIRKWTFNKRYYTFEKNRVLQCTSLVISLSSPRKMSPGK